MEATTHFSARDLAYTAVFAALLAICSWISIPTAVPFTMQTFGVFLTMGLLGGKRGTAAVVVFLLMAALGIPVLAGFTGGVFSSAPPADTSWASCSPPFSCGAWSVFSERA